MSNRNSILNKNRYRLYREHKYIFYVFSDFLRLAARLDLSNKNSLIKFKKELKKLEHLLQAHAEYEETRIHSILEKHDSSLFNEVERQHQDQNYYFETINKKINSVSQNYGNKIEADFLNYKIYLDLRNFFKEILNHFDYEERIIMPKLQRFLTDDEIKEIDRISYRQMLPEQMIHMMEVLFPHMNREDKFTFLNDIKECEPEKFESAWAEIYWVIEENERNQLMELLNVNKPDKKPNTTKKLFYPWEQKPEGDCELMTDYHKK